ncbi:MAG: 4a-hydroxytetrahydrobiopterin dehydratase [Burkholderiaceae bacterium]|jgi:4a-hydroxytetrahydrobiopterin dehydratase|nr:4a-hydroxytetrahydrobiopterin dehydratase [Burkholderiaceae bacterium]
MRSREQLLAAHCRPVTSPAMSGEEVKRQLEVLPDWQLVRGALSRTFRFADYCETIAFVNAIVHMIHSEDHHPDLCVGYDRCEVSFSTHSAGGITDNDFICAAKTDAIHAHRYGSAAA